MDKRTRPRAVGDEEALLFIIQIVTGAAALVLVASLVRPPILGETLGFFAMWGRDVPVRAADLGSGSPRLALLGGCRNRNGGSGSIASVFAMNPRQAYRPRRGNRR